MRYVVVTIASSWPLVLQKSSHLTGLNHVLLYFDNSIDEVVLHLGVRCLASGLCCEINFQLLPAGSIISSHFYCCRVTDATQGIHL